MNNVQETSVEAYHDSGKTRSKIEQAILAALETAYDMTNKELSDYLKRPINTITPATLHLRVRGLVVKNPAYERGIRNDRTTGKRALAWVLKSKVTVKIMPPAFAPKPEPEAPTNHSLF